MKETEHPVTIDGIGHTDNCGIEAAQMPPSTAMRTLSKGGRVLIAQKYNDMEIVVKRRFGVTELAVNGMVYAEERVLFEKSSYALEANVHHVIVKATMGLDDSKTIQRKPMMRLYVNGNLLAEKERLF